MAPGRCKVPRLQLASLALLVAIHPSMARAQPVVFEHVALYVTELAYPPILHRLIRIELMEWSVGGGTDPETCELEAVIRNQSRRPFRDIQVLASMSFKVGMVRATGEDDATDIVWLERTARWCPAQWTGQRRIRNLRPLEKRAVVFQDLPIGRLAWARDRSMFPTTCRLDLALLGASDDGANQTGGPQTCEKLVTMSPGD